MDRGEKTLKVLELVVLAGSAIWVGMSTHYVGQQVGEMRNAQNFTVEMERRRKALEFIQRFNTREIHSILEDAVKVMQAASNGQKVDWHPVQPLLNFYEEIAMSVKEQLADQEITRRFFQRMMLGTYKSCQPVIDAGLDIHTSKRYIEIGQRLNYLRRFNLWNGNRDLIPASVHVRRTAPIMERTEEQEVAPGGPNEHGSHCASLTDTTFLGLAHSPFAQSIEQTVRSRDTSRHGLLSTANCSA